MVVLTNKTSASASELFSSALRDVINVPLVGTSTWGKGIGQTTFKLSDGSGVKITTFKYFTKSRTDYNEIGLKPDYEVTLPEEKAKIFYSLDETNDDQLIKAIEVLRKSF
jgi:carboxyl-terminal processing protease